MAELPQLILIFLVVKVYSIHYRAPLFLSAVFRQLNIRFQSKQLSDFITLLLFQPHFLPYRFLFFGIKL